MFLRSYEAMFRPFFFLLQAKSTRGRAAIDRRTARHSPMKKALLFAILCLSVSFSPAQFRRAVFWRHSVGLCFWDRSQVSNLTPPTTVTKEVAAYNAAHGYTGSAAVSMSELYFPGPEGVVNDNNWYRWDAVFAGRDSYGQTVNYATPVLVVKTCYLSQQGMKSIDSIEAYKAHIRHIVTVMKNHPNNFFVIWTNYPAATDGRADRAAWSNTFSTWMKQTLATGNDSFGPFPPNVYVFDVFHLLASPVDGYCDPIYGSGSEGPGDDHPSNAAVAIVDPAFIRETFDAAIAYEPHFAPVVATLSASNITTSGLQLNGSVNPNGFGTTCHFEYGTTASYGTSTAVQNPGSGTGAVPVSASISGLTAGTLYHFRLVATSSMGTTYGSDSTVTTTPPPTSPPTVVTLTAGNITTTSAQLNGSVNPNGSSTEYHFEYGLTGEYGNSTLVANAGAGYSVSSASAGVTALLPGTMYHYRLVATNGIGTSYGVDSTFSTLTPPPPPEIITSPPDNIAPTGARLNGSVNPHGYSTTYHFEYGTTAGYGLSTPPTAAGSGTVALPVSATVNGLAPGILYHVRLVGSSIGGTVFGNDTTFTTIILPPVALTREASGITTTGGIIHGDVNPNGLSTDYHFEYGPGTTYGSSTSTVNAGTGIAGVAVNAQLSTLRPGSTYHYRIVAVNGGGTTYGSDSSFVTATPLPTTVTLAATGITTTGAELNGSVTPNGFATTYHFEYGTSTAYGSSTQVADAGAGEDQVAVNSAVVALSPGTLYHYHLVARNAGGTAYGNDTTFTTVTPLPTVLTSPASAIGTSGAILHGEVNPNGFTTSYHFEYGLTKSYSAVTPSQNAGAGTASLPESATLTGLSPGSLYHFRFVATSTGGTAYGTDTTFTTLIPPPAVVTLGASNISTTGAQLNGTVNPNGFSSKYRFEFGTTTGYGTSTDTIDAGSGMTPAAVNAVLSGLSPGVTYHFRLVASNGGGNSFGGDATFNSAMPPPGVTTGPASNITTTTGQLNGTVNPNGFTTNYHFQYGTTISYGLTTSSHSAGSGSVPVAENASVSSLSPGTTYHCRLVASNGGGTTNGNDTTFTTSIPPPTVVTSGTSNISPTGAKLNASVNPNGFATSAYFEFGTSTGYGLTTSSQSLGSGTGAVSVNALLGDLAPGTLYHYHIVATNSGGTSYGADSAFTTSSYSVVSIVVLLQGPYTGQGMSTELNSNGILAAHFKTVTIPGNAVDSINIEIRDSLQGARATLRRFAPAWLLADGSIKDFFDTTRGYIGFIGVPAGAYFIVVRHRNHLGILTSVTQALDATVPPAVYDFSTGENRAYGTSPMIGVAGRYAMYAGDVTGDGILKYNGPGNDRAVIYSLIGGGNINWTVSGYWNADVNLDGFVKYNGPGNDRAIIYSNIGGGNVNATVQAQMP